MATQLKIITTDGRVIYGVNYRMPSYSTPTPSTPASPGPFAGGVYHVQTASGWVDILESDVAQITPTPGAMT